jgi:hypothetical protein
MSKIVGRRGKKRSNYVAGFDELLEDPNGEWVTIDPEAIHAAYYTYYYDPNVRTAVSFRMNAMLNGGILIRSSAYNLKPEAMEWQQAQWSRMTREQFRDFICVGFAPGTFDVHLKYGPCPREIDLLQVITRYRLSRLGVPEYEYWYQPNDGTQGMVKIENVTTFTMTAPDNYGNLQSIMTLLGPDMMQEMMINYYSMVAIKSRACLPLITEMPREPYDTNNITVPMATDPKQIALVRAAAGLKGSRPPTEEVDSSVAINTQIRSYYTQTRPAAAHRITSNLGTIQCVPFFSSHTKLEQGRKFVAPPMPDGPSDLVLTFRIARKERVYSLLNVPLAMETNSTSTGTSKQQGSNPNSYVLFDNAQQELKLILINCIKTLFRKMHAPDLVRQYMKDTDRSRWTKEGVSKTINIVVELPSMPNEELLMQYYKDGFLKYDSVIEYLSSKHGIDPSKWNPKPGLTIKELAGEFADPPGVAAKKKKS